MQAAMVRVASVVLDVALRIWMKDEKTYISNSALDIERLAFDLGCGFFEKDHLEINIKQCITSIGEKLYAAHFLDGVEEGRKSVLVNQIIDDLENVNVFDKEFLQMVMLSKDITPKIMKYSEHRASRCQERLKCIFRKF